MALSNILNAIRDKIRTDLAANSGVQTYTKKVLKGEPSKLTAYTYIAVHTPTHTLARRWTHGASPKSTSAIGLRLTLVTTRGEKLTLFVDSVIACLNTNATTYRKSYNLHNPRTTTSYDTVPADKGFLYICEMEIEWDYYGT